MKRKKVSVHTPGKPMRFFVLMMGLVVAGLHAFILRTMGAETTDFPLALMGLVLFFDAILLWWAIIFTTQSRVTLFEEGIELERGNSKVYTPWENVSHLGVKGFGRNQRRGLFLHEKVTPETKGIEKLFFGWKSGFLNIGRYVHLHRVWNPFSRQLNMEKILETEFGQDLYAVAPHLFDEYEDWKPKNRLEDGYVDNREFTYLDDSQSEERKQEK